ncbi:hypothetical protein BDZ89DRAFT_496345 [Hymenopellis radicata]|nr:hypothetical protein BDZ89DRAFT_496345 [Hymenopellis radicata]
MTVVAVEHVGKGGGRGQRVYSSSIGNQKIIQLPSGRSEKGKCCHRHWSRPTTWTTLLCSEFHPNGKPCHRACVSPSVFFSGYYPTTGLGWTGVHHGVIAL